MKLRFSLYFIVGLILWLLSLGIVFMFTIDVIFPIIDLKENDRWYDLIVILIFLLNILLCSLLYALYFGGPLWFMLSWIQQLTYGKYEPPYTKWNVYTKKNKLRLRYKLYEEVIVNIHSLAEHLKRAEIDRQKLDESKRDWMAGISHDLKTPLTYITGYSALLLNEEYSWTEEEKTSFINEISHKSHHIDALIQDLNLSFKMNNSDSPIPLNKSQGNIIEFTKKLIADVGNDPRSFNYYLSFQSKENNIEIAFDEHLIYRALQNLIMNAILHNPEGTSVKVSVINNGEEFIEIVISDDGVGMDQYTIDNLFKKYYRGTTTNSSEFGTGLGMAIVKSLILAHGGEINVESEVSKGTSLTVRLPK
ncbi:sensor histidine kinase [Bacillus solimangrovi]|uniref:histidine kinase n=1 Tax=Bacillus solimangrovi TaxID=1305675 RepID=A0A1E5LK13_9BACI|nr:HAMP domain-containing sensor histidine kinase [Bacillus solimangrovi]OEH94432.1 two-component sensor histidine kinase [Bacillus solimangrovi]